MEKRVTFRNLWLPYLLLAPQVIITMVFFIWPTSQALFQSMLVEDPFGLSSEFVWFENFDELLADSHYWASMQVTAVFAIATTVLAMSSGLFLAIMADRVIKGATIYKVTLLWPYAVAPAVAGVLWLFLFSPANGIIAQWLQALGYQWNHVLNGGEAMFLVVIAASWKQVAYNFLFFLAGLQSIPKSLLEAAAIDGASPAKRFWTIIFPLLSPVTFFLLVINVVYAFFDTFGIIHAVTSGGPAGATNTLVYKVYSDGFVGLDLGGSAAQSVVLMVIVGILTVVQFRYLEKKVQY